MSIHKACKPVLVAYATREGQTRKIAEHVAATLRARNFEVDVVDVGSDEPVELPFYCAAILLASLHLRKHEREMTAFAKTNHDVLARMPTAFLSVSLAEAGAEDSSRSPALRAEAATGVREAIDAFVAETKLHPAHVHPVEGVWRDRAARDARYLEARGRPDGHLPRLRAHGLARARSLRRRDCGGVAAR